jgi:L-ascorbate metabolism protein UlaG (beta-lactamase superfamily)
MKVTKYPQSCLLIEEEGRRLLIDPGSFVSKQFTANDLLPVDAILITHEHADHLDSSLLKSLTAQGNIPVVGNASTAEAHAGVITKVVSDRDSFDVAGFHVTVRELPHCLMLDGSPGPQNSGYVIDGVFFHPGDGISIDDLRVENAAVPIAGPDVSPKDIYGFIRQLGCKAVVPIHYDYFPNDPKFVAQLLQSMNDDVKVVVLDNGQSTDI